MPSRAPPGGNHKRAARAFFFCGLVGSEPVLGLGFDPFVFVLERFEGGASGAGSVLARAFFFALAGLGSGRLSSLGFDPPAPELAFAAVAAAAPSSVDWRASVTLGHSRRSHLRRSHGCFIVPGPPNLTMSRHGRHFLHSLARHLSHSPHRVKRNFGKEGSAAAPDDDAASAESPSCARRVTQPKHTNFFEAHPPSLSSIVAISSSE